MAVSPLLASMTHGFLSSQSSRALQVPPRTGADAAEISKPPTIVAQPGTTAPAPNPMQPPAKTPAPAVPVTPGSQGSTPAPVPADQSAASQPSPQAPTRLTVQHYAGGSATDIPEVPVRVGIVLDQSQLTLATANAGVITDEQGQVLQSLAPQTATAAVFSSGGVQIGSLSPRRSVWVQSASNGLTYVNGRWYRGAIELIADQGKVLAVNHIEMQPYLYSVVGAEMYQSWPAEALKAQAIAARSYALVHIVRPASHYFDLGATQRWQAYKGVETEAGSTLAAVDATHGMIISYDGGVVESLYASSDSLVREAHSGFGMSQHSARDLAQQNLSFSQILNRFYPGTHLALLQAE
ncbi:SpoIID/LytB domain-containing protein [Lyngbya confervoides]|uniref:SpoIID/LytB domain-containing protein n=1 Tax=Lyngbya confervoides BDU141951 TaxID=1574623 RepID=A0ABD4SZD2_9CYAN|nr:SpoIID/LytB domain-containing protein [Lyngbya confervoides]MCM1981667.1 SpoIID/LytB domain-containing protein [Lyngbya confervoides BDU141951]